MQAMAQWDTNAWPSVNFPRQGRLHGENVRDALRERFDVSGVGGAPPSHSLWRFQRTFLIGNKNKIKNVISAGYIQQDTTNAPDGTWTTNVLDINWTDAKLWTISNLCIAVGIPTNFFDYTPWRSLSGLGGHTNDQTVGNAYGFTNSNTMNGGTNFPGSRTNWYTTDYGWQGMKDSIDKLIWTVGGIGETSILSFASGEQTTNSYAGVRALVEADYAPGIFRLAETASHLWGAPVNTFARAGSDGFAGVVSGIYTGFEHTVDFYLRSTVAARMTGNLETNIYDNHGFNITEDIQTRYSSIVSFSASVTSSVIGGLTNVPTWGPDPISDGETIRGFVLAPVASIIKWTETTNGFQFVE